MNDRRILFVVPNEDREALEFANALKASLAGWNITITDAKLTTLLFESRKHDLTHFFIRANGKYTPFARKFNKMQSVQTILSRPQKAPDWKKLIFGQTVIVFSQTSRHQIQQVAPATKVEAIPPCVGLPDSTQIIPASEIRDRFQVEDRMLVLALNNMREQKEFDSFLYIARELNRREVFRLLLPMYEKNKTSESWRSKLQYSIDMEKLGCVTIIEPEDLHSLIDACDIALYIRRRPQDDFEFPLRTVETLLRGKPMLSFVQSPISEVVKEFKENWAINNTEDFVRETRDLKKEEARLEEISTELAGFARSRMDQAAVASAYEAIYNRLLSQSRPVHV